MPPFSNLYSQIQILLANGKKIVKGLRTLRSISKQCRRVIDSCIPNPVLFDPGAMFSGDAKILSDHTRGGDPAKAYHDFGADQTNLPIEVTNAAVLLLFHGISVLRRPALDDIRNITIATPVKINDRKHIIQQLTGSADKGLALKILLLTGTFPDEHNIGILSSNAENHIMPGFAQSALPAIQTGSL